MIGYIIAGTIVVVIAAKIIFDMMIYRRCTGKTEGKIIFIEERTDKDSTARFIRYYFVPIYEYTVDGHTYHVETREYSRDMGKYDITLTYEVKYNPNNPEECLIEGKKGIMQKESRL